MRRNWQDASETLSSGEIQGHLVDIAPAPGFPSFQRSDDGMPGRVKVLGGVFVLGRIATAYVTAGEAEAQVYPGIPHLQTLFAALGAWTYVFDLIQMLAG